MRRFFIPLIVIIALLSGCSYDANIHTFRINNNTTTEQQVVKFAGSETYSIPASSSISIDMSFYQADNTFSLVSNQSRNSIIRNGLELNINAKAPDTYNVLNNLSVNVTLLNTLDTSFSCDISSHSVESISIWDEAHRFVLSGTNTEGTFSFIQNGSDKIFYTIMIDTENKRIIISAI